MVDDLAIRTHGAGPPVLLVHGTAASVWGDVIRRLADEARVVDYDRRSFGGSGGEPLADLSLHARDAAAVLERHASEPAVVVGWSIGGVVALELAAERPELVRALVLVEPPLHVKRHPSVRVVRAVAGTQILRRLGRDERAATRFLAWALRDRDGGAGFARLPAEARAACLANAGAIAREVDGGTGEHLGKDALGAIGAPTTVLAGLRSDPAFEAAARRAADFVPGATLRTVEGSGHAVALDRPDAVVDAVREHLGARELGSALDVRS
jgi:3-oxoadipate enol-lactonase